MFSIDDIKKTLEAQFNTLDVQVRDFSLEHAGHHHQTGFPTHVEVTLSSKHFEGLSTVKQHQLVYKAVQKFIDLGLHALKINATAETAKQSRLELKPNRQFKGRPGPLLLIVMDGVGIGKPEPGNAVYNAKMPVLNELMQSKLYTHLKAHGTAVGMPSDEDMGNSEVGHNALGAGRIFAQGARLVAEAVSDGRLFEGETWKKVVSHVLEKNSTLHLIGLLSDGNVHAHIDHTEALINEAAKAHVKQLRLHVLLDGRDVEGCSGLTYLERIESVLSQKREQGLDYKIGSGGGRMHITMDRYKADWDMVKRGWETHVLGIADKRVSSAKEALQNYYDEGGIARTDQYCDSFVVVENQKPIGIIEDGDAVIMTHFRGDRAIELSQAFEDKVFPYFDRHRHPNVLFAGMMQYDGDLQIPSHYLVDPPAIDRSMSEYLCAMNVSSFAISETQKYGHVTYFWNGNKSGYVNEALETYVEIPSDRIPFDQKPEMKAYEITEKTIALLQSGHYGFGRVNFPNGDMVGHTGVFEAAKKACEVTDECVGQLIETVNALNGITLVLADHGNADEMFSEKNGQKIPKTAHTLNPVPFAIIDKNYAGEYQLASLETPGLANVASTVFFLLGYEKPSEYEPSLVVSPSL